MNEIIFFGLNLFPKLFKNKQNSIKKSIQFKFENENEKQIKQISSGYFSTIFLFKNGKAIEYLNENNSNENPSKIQIEENIQKVSVGFENEAILTKEGNNNSRYCFWIFNLLINFKSKCLWNWFKSYGQLGFDSETLKKTEKPILMMKNVSKIFSGNCSDCVFLLNSNQELFGCGFNYHGQVGLGESRKEEKIQKLTKIQNIPKGKIIDIQCGFNHSIMLIEEDQNENPKRKLYSCGDYIFNGLDKNEDDTYEFTEIKSSLFENDNILDFSVGHSHTLILTSNSKLIGFGSNRYGQLRTEDTNDKSIPIQIELPKLRFNEDISNYHISCGYNKSFLYYSPFFFQS
ncbi:regulator of chromosome condensation [Anaeramoeba ignava]|uniref:Regulator of chromosome condensation n=1 Tax=Anaeramoeba ignava TaxID=1746090 RepID=A0A9Q0RGF0_ANAIG|nr:regulator of chromosome condensation [Anaeramoeba ignava]